MSLTKSVFVGIECEQVLEIVTPEKYDEMQEFVDQENTMKEAIKTQIVEYFDHPLDN